MSVRLSKMLGSSGVRVLGMLHMAALPGTPRNSRSVARIGDEMLREAELYSKHGVHGLILENMHDLPYVQGAAVGPEVTAAAAVIATRLRQALPDTPLGLQLLAGANQQALSVAHAAQLDFIRAEGYVFSHVADEGLMNACAGELLRFRKQIGADDVAVFADIKKKHCSHSITADITLGETARAAHFFSADGVIVTGTETGIAPSPMDVHDVRDAVPDLPVLVGSGVTAANVHEFQHAYAVIVGSYLKEHGHWAAPVCAQRLRTFMDAVQQIHSS